MNDTTKTTSRTSRVFEKTAAAVLYVVLFFCIGATVDLLIDLGGRLVFLSPALVGAIRGATLGTAVRKVEWCVLGGVLGALVGGIIGWTGGAFHQLVLATESLDAAVLFLISDEYSLEILGTVAPLSAIEGTVTSFLIWGFRGLWRKYVESVEEPPVDVRPRWRARLAVGSLIGLLLVCRHHRSTMGWRRPHGDGAQGVLASV